AAPTSRMSALHYSVSALYFSTRLPHRPMPGWPLRRCRRPCCRPSVPTAPTLDVPVIGVGNTSLPASDEGGSGLSASSAGSNPSASSTSGNLPANSLVATLLTVAVRDNSLTTLATTSTSTSTLAIAKVDAAARRCRVSRPHQAAPSTICSSPGLCST